MSKRWRVARAGLPQAFNGGVPGDQKVSLETTLPAFVLSVPALNPLLL
jgi:hypothetical protein